MTRNNWTIVDSPLAWRIQGEPAKRAIRVTSLADLREAAGLEDPEIGGILADLPWLRLPDLEAASFPAKPSLTLYLGGAGELLAYSDKLAALKRPGVSVFLPPTRQGITDLRILSSLGVRCGILFGREVPDWDFLTDLLCYAAYTKTPHAWIEPFAYVHANYKGPSSQLDWRDAYFRDAGRGPTAPEDAFGGGLTACTSCPGWRVCGGALSAYLSPEGAPCREFASALLETAEYVHAKNNI